MIQCRFLKNVSFLEFGLSESVHWCHISFEKLLANIIFDLFSVLLRLPKNRSILLIESCFYLSHISHQSSFQPSSGVFYLLLKILSEFPIFGYVFQF